jgi:putative oxidoreductase
MSTGIGLAILRISLGLLLAGHGSQKLFGWFHGHGLSETPAFFDSVGYRPGRITARLAGLCKLTAGLMLALGLLTPLAAAIGVGVLLAASAVHAANGLWATDGGFELPGFYAIAAAALGFTGPGRYALDGWLGLHWSWRHGLAAMIVGTMAGALAILSRRLVQPVAATPESSGTRVDDLVPAQRPQPAGYRLHSVFFSRRVFSR